MGLIKLAAVGAAGYALYKYVTREKEMQGAFAGHFTPVRDAGPGQMKSPPDHWSRTDESIDESFPASDPPATY